MIAIFLRASPNPFSNHLGIQVQAQYYLFDYSGIIITTSWDLESSASLKEINGIQRPTWLGVVLVKAVNVFDYGYSIK